MSTSTIIIGESGTGKSASLRNFDKSECLLIQCLRKPLPFKNDWTEVGIAGGNILVSDQAEQIIHAMQKTQKKIIIIDDLQYLILHEFLNRSAEIGYTKFTEMAIHLHSILLTAGQLTDPSKRVYILSHSDTNELGRTKFKTIGKLLDEKIVVEGMVTLVLKSIVQDNNYLLTTRNSGMDTVKTPMGMFSENEPKIPNDLKLVDQVICEYYGIK